MILTVPPTASVGGRSGRPGSVLEYVVGTKRRAKGSPGIAGRRLYPHAFEAAVPQDFAVGDTIEGYSTSQAEVLRTGLCGKSTGEAKHHLLGDRLDRGRQIEMALGEELVRLARGSLEQLLESPVRHAQARAVVEVGQISRNEPSGLRSISSSRIR